MSGQIRTNLGRTRAAAEKIYDYYGQLLSNDPAPWNQLQKAVFMCELKRAKKQLKNLEKYFDDWDDLISRIRDEAEKEEERIKMNEWRDKEEFVNLFENLDRMIEGIQAMLDVVPDTSHTAVPLQANVPVPQVQVHASSSQASVTFGCSQVQASGAAGDASSVLQGIGTNPLVAMPRCDIAKFNGDHLKWNAFWQRFNQNIHIRPYSKVEKMDALLGLLEGKALDVVDGFLVSDENYDTVIQTLFKRFGNKKLVLNKLYEKLRSIEPAKYGGDIDINNGSLQMDIIEKMPPRERDELSFLTVSSPCTTTQDILERMELLVLRTEVSSEHKSKSLATPKSVSSDRSSKTVGCSFCDESHRSWQCSKFTSVDERIKRLRSVHACTKCASKSHEAKACQSTVKCRDCNGQHYAYLCTRKSSNGESSNSDTRAFVSIEKTQGNLLTKEITVINPEDEKEIKVIALFDSGSQRTYVSDNLIDQLKLSVHNIEKLDVQGFGSKVTVYNSKLVKLRIKTVDAHKDIYANSTKYYCKCNTCCSS
uniref:Peptidase aspartic putative domain-containing protein n=1 Tax=Panagrolaimus superbus TaxID=310955 RepID=A0A914Y643_9BILA